ncbi:MAG: hypothetical protein JO114_06920 [Planctomycetaceae bacterium]|nr:hypothetical protein [Planctomycetaceae bacterium]MBV8311165.1 hypothetical protein [Planctomycetaceae bacterium]
MFVLEGTNRSSNLAALQTMASASTNRLIHFVAVKGFDHFNILAPANDMIASKILHDEGPTTSITFSEEELNELRQQGPGNSRVLIQKRLPRWR